VVKWAKIFRDPDRNSDQHQIASETSTVKKIHNNLTTTFRVISTNRIFNLSRNGKSPLKIPGSES